MENPNKIWKAELAELFGFSQKTLSFYLNVLNFDELKKLGYRKTQKYLTKPQLDFLFPTGIKMEVNRSKQNKTEM